MRIAVFGAGPAGFFATEELLKRPGCGVTADLFDRLPTPYGLVRGGVAPDHENTKAVIKQFEKTAARPGFRFFGNVTFGADLSLAEVLAHYHQVLLATGAEGDRRLGVPGEDLPGSHASTAFVGWYNGHPDYRERFDLGAEHGWWSATAMSQDVARILTRWSTIRADGHCRTRLEVFVTAESRSVLLGRRGLRQARFHPEPVS